MRVLVVHEDDTARAVVRDLLTEIACDSVSFVSLDEALQIAKDRSLNPELVLLDFDAAGVIRVQPQLATLFPEAQIARITASALETTAAVLRAAHRDRTRREETLTARMRRIEKSNDDLMRVVCVDQLTGVANRRHFDDLLNTEWGRAARDDAPLSLVMLDLDDFHALNERYGHLGGDDCLRRVAKVMAGCPRRPSDSVARYGGEEFVVLLPDTDLRGAYIVAERIRSQIEQLRIPHAGSRCSSYVTVSAGVATCAPSAAQICETLVAEADSALFLAKKAGRNRICAEPTVPTLRGPTPGSRHLKRSSKRTHKSTCS